MSYLNSDIEPLYPQEVIYFSTKDKKEYFKETVLVNHLRLKEVMDELKEKADPASGPDIVFLIGPTGVGKSALTKSFVRQTNEIFLPEMQSNKSLIPIIWVEAPSDGQSRFPWKSLYQDMLVELKEPLVDKKVEYRLMEGHLLLQNLKKEPTHAALSASVIKALKHRVTHTCIVDEAVHIIERSSEKQIKAQMSTLKSLSNRCETTFVLVGSYDLLALMALSGQLSRRSRIVPFDRYKKNDKDVEAFMCSLADLQRYLPVPEIPDLIPFGDVLFESCLGCVGILKDILRSLLSKLLEGEKFSDQLLKKCLLTKNQVTTILHEINEGEKLLAKFD